MAHMSPEQAMAYRARWAILARHEAEELRAATVALKAQQLDALFASRDLFPADPNAWREAAALSERWRLIRTASRA